MISIYSQSESGFMKQFQQRKAVWLEPVLKKLTVWKIDADMVSFASGAIALIGLNQSLNGGNAVYFVLSIWLHFFLDGIDGSLARYQNRETELGTLYDLLADSSGIILTGVYLTLFSITGGALAALFVGSYLCVNTFSYFLAERGEQYPFVIRPRVYVYSAMLVDLIFGTTITPFFIFISYFILGYFSFVGLDLIFSKKPE